jgi:putative pyruvate formate lyase activating enzyme
MDPLRRYGQILQNECRPRYLICKSIPVDIVGNETLDELWALHNDGMRELRGSDIGSSASPCSGNDLLDLKLTLANALLRNCCLCERRCNVDRSLGEKGSCGVVHPRIACDFIHHGEEAPLVPSYTVFLSGCNLTCVFCQNHDISTDPECGTSIDPHEMAQRIEQFKTMGGKEVVLPRDRQIMNVNWVGGDPTPSLHYILDVLVHCRCDIPQIWNSNMYLSEEAMLLLEGTMDIYLTDLKYGNDICAQRLSGVQRYMEVVTRNHLMALRQCEVIVRHLMLPGHIECCTIPVIEWLSENMTGAFVNLMAQYHPMHRASEFPELKRQITIEEYHRAIRHARMLRLDLV